MLIDAKGFEYEVIEEGVTLFFISADRMVSDRQDRFMLEGVELRMEEENGELYTVASDRAIYDLESRQAQLEGSVLMSGPDGLELTGEAFDLLRGGRLLQSTRPPASYRLPGGYVGTAGVVRLNLNRNSVTLRGGVAIDSAPDIEPAMRLTAAKMFYEEDRALLRAEGDVVFVQGQDRLSSQRLSVAFAPGRDGAGVGDVRFIQGRWQVRGALGLEGEGQTEGRLEFEAEKMGVTFDDSGDRVEPDCARPCAPSRCSPGSPTVGWSGSRPMCRW